jgi:hypothetical protein
VEEVEIDRRPAGDVELEADGTGDAMGRVGWEEGERESERGGGLCKIVDCDRDEEGCS